VRIGIDLDGVVYDFVRACNQWVIGNEPDPYHSLAIAHPTAEHWHFYEDWGYSAEEYRALVLRGVAADYIFRMGTPMDDAIRGLNRLKGRKHTIHFVTSRDFGTLSHSHTVAWLRDWGITYDSLTFTNEKTLVDVDLFLDDHAPHVDALRAKGVKAFLLDLQRSETQGHQHLVRSWSDFVDEVDIEADRRTHPGERTDEERRTLLAGGSIGKKDPPHRFIPVFEEALEPEAAAAYAHVRGVDGPGAYAQLPGVDPVAAACATHHVADKNGEVRVVDPNAMRTFESGATRNVDETKLDYEGFLSPAALRLYAEYLQKNRVQADGNVRDSDNWQKGIPLNVYMKSAWRHFIAAWTAHRSGSDPSEDLCGLLFNAMGYLHEWDKGPGVAT